MWAAESSRSFQEYTKFNSYFVPFYRASQVISTLKPEFQKADSEYVNLLNDSYMFNEILNADYWEELFDLSIEIKNIEATYENGDETVLVRDFKDNTIHTHMNFVYL